MEEGEDKKNKWRDYSEIFDDLLEKPEALKGLLEAVPGLSPAVYWWLLGKASPSRAERWNDGVCRARLLLRCGDIEANPGPPPEAGTEAFEKERSLWLALPLRLEDDDIAILIHQRVFPEDLPLLEASVAGLQRAGMPIGALDRLCKYARPEAGSRKVSRLGVRSRPSLRAFVDEQAESKLWYNHVKGLVKCEMSDASDDSVKEWLPAADTSLVEARWLHFQLVEGQDPLDLTNLRNARAACGGSVSAINEISWHPALLLFFEAAANGQPGVRFAREVHTGGAREDIQGLITPPGMSEIPVAPGECKIDFTCASRDLALFTGHQQEGLAKLLKVCWSNLCHYGRTFICVFAAICKFVWVVKFEFVDKAGELLPGEAVLRACDVVPLIPSARPAVSDDCVLCPKLTEHLGNEDIKTLAELVQSGEGGCAPPGFRLLVRFVLAQCCLWGVQPVTKLTLLLEGHDTEWLVGEPMEVIHSGGRSLVLGCVNKKDFVIKIGHVGSIEQEFMIHSIVDGHSPHLCPMYKDPGLPDFARGARGTVTGAGDELSFLCLTPRCEGSIKRLDVDSDKNFELYFDQAAEGLTILNNLGVLHRDLKPENLLITRRAEDGTKQLYLNDYDLACRNDEGDTLMQVVGNDSCRSPFFDGRSAAYSEQDDRLGLVLAFLHLKGILKSSDKEAKVAVLKEVKHGGLLTCAPKRMMQWLKGDGRL